MNKEKENDDPTSLKALSVTPALTALLKPTATYLGQELRNYVKATMEDWKKRKRVSNLEAHLQGVREKLASDSPKSPRQEPSFSQIELFDEWIDGAQDVDPQDVELSDIWRNLLAEAARGDRIPIEVITTLKSLSPREAQFLSRMASSGASGSGLRSFARQVSESAEDRHLANALKAKSIIERDSQRPIAASIAFGIFAFCFLKFTNAGSYGFIWAGGMLACLLLSPFRHFVLSWRLAWLGQQIIKFVSEPAAEKPTGT